MMHNEGDGIRYGFGRSDEVAATLLREQGLQGRNSALFYGDGASSGDHTHLAWCLVPRDDLRSPLGVILPGSGWRLSEGWPGVSSRGTVQQESAAATPRDGPIPS